MTLWEYRLYKTKQVPLANNLLLSFVVIVQEKARAPYSAKTGGFSTVVSHKNRRGIFFSGLN